LKYIHIRIYVSLISDPYPNIRRISDPYLYLNYPYPNLYPKIITSADPIHYPSVSNPFTPVKDYMHPTRNYMVYVKVLVIHVLGDQLCQLGFILVVIFFI
jgi:hypothetical protein